MWNAAGKFLGTSNGNTGTALDNAYFQTTRRMGNPRFDGIKLDNVDVSISKPCLAKTASVSPSS